jgi:serine/threonine-protein kinase
VTERAVALQHDHLVLGRYRPLRPLGSGGSGSVWLARDERAARDVALKVVPREGKAGSRAEREVEAAARLRHPGCLRALALHRDARHVYVAYEYVPGRTLREALREGSLADPHAVEACAQILDALAHAHGAGVIHRDVKPANVMLRQSEDISVRLLDFGLARVDETETLTAAGDVPGTLAYIAPERLEGAPASGAADVWSVGVILWEALSGWHPFAAASPVETARRIAAGAPSLAAERPDLPRELTDAVDAMLAREPAARPKPKRLAALLRSVWAERTSRRRPAASRTIVSKRALHAGLAATFVAGATLLLPFFPAGAPFFLAAVAALAAFRSPLAGLALALAAPVLPLGNISLGLGLAYAPLALAWLLVFARETRSSLFVLAGPFLAPLGILPLLPLVTLRVRNPVRRAALGGGGVLLATAVAAIRAAPQPLTGGADAAFVYLGANPAALVEALVVAAAAVAAPYALRLEIWGAAGWGAAFLAAALLAPAAAGAPLPAALGPTLAVWAATAALAGRALNTPR